eukprot:3533185-Pyramimonas_sp.AAC.1
MQLRIDRADQISKVRTVDKVNRLAIKMEKTWTIRGCVDEGGGQGEVLLPNRPGDAPQREPSTVLSPFRARGDREALKAVPNHSSSTHHQIFCERPA